MTRLLLILIIQGLCIGEIKSQDISVDDLVAISDLPSKNVDNYMNRKGFLSGGKSFHDNVISARFFQKINNKVKDSVDVTRSLEVYKTESTCCFALHTSSPIDYQNGLDWLRNAGFIYDSSKMSNARDSIIFQKKNLTVRVNTSREDSVLEYTFLLEKKEIPAPSSIRFGDDLLRFDSHEYLSSFFGEKNVKKDVYYFSDKEMKKCSILYPNSNRQAIFVWDDEVNYCKLSYILISGVLPTADGNDFNGNFSMNRWSLRNGIYSGMSLRELLNLNGKDFRFFGGNSEFAYMIEPRQDGNIDFKKMGIMLGCLNCAGSFLLEKRLVSAEDAVGNNLSLHIFYIMVSP